MDWRTRSVPCMALRVVVVNDDKPAYRNKPRLRRITFVSCMTAVCRPARHCINSLRGSSQQGTTTSTVTVVCACAVALRTTRTTGPLGGWRPSCDGVLIGLAALALTVPQQRLLWLKWEASTRFSSPPRVRRSRLLQYRRILDTINHELRAGGSSTTCSRTQRIVAELELKLITITC